MRTDNLLRALAADAVIERPRLGLHLGLGALAAFAAVAGGLGLRAGVGAALAEPAVTPKLLLPLFVAGLALAALRGRVPAVALAAPVLAALALVGATWPGAGVLAAITGDTLLACLVTIPLLALPVGAALLRALARTVVPDPGRAGALAGAVAGGVAAAVYALHCPEDAPAFYAPWYGCGIVVAALVGRLAGRRYLGV